VKKSRLERARAALRLAHDGALVSVAELVRVAGQVRGAVLIRWIKEGKSGIFLDGIKRGSEWYSSRAAVERFRARLAQAGVKGGAA
jgi:hypothetical protein